MSNETIKTAVPLLRFPEFREASGWVEKPLNQICQVNPTVAELPETFVYIDLESVENGVLLQKKIVSKKDSPSRAQRLLQNGDVIFQTVRPYQRNNYFFQSSDDNDYVASTGYAQLRAHQSHGYLFQYVHTNDFVEKVLAKCTGSSYPAINSNDLSQIQVVIPSLEEQQKIAACLSSLDDLLTAQTAKLAALQAHKRGLLQGLFPAAGETVPKLRFPEFWEAGEWVEKTLGEVAVFAKGKGISKADVVPNGTLPCIRYGELYTHYGEEITSVKSYTNVSSDDLILSQINDVIIPASGETQEDIATASCVMINRVALGGDLNIIRTSMNGIFLSLYLNSAKKQEIAQLAQGISVVHLYPNQLKKLIVCVPDLEEQQKITACILSLNNRITAQTQQIEALQLHKKGLMQGLFPTTPETTA